MPERNGRLAPERVATRASRDKSDPVRPEPVIAFVFFASGYFHIDIAEVQTEDGKLYTFVAVDRTSKFAYAELHPRATRTVANGFLSKPRKGLVIPKKGGIYLLIYSTPCRADE